MDKKAYLIALIFSIIFGLLGLTIIFNPVKTVIVITILLSIIIIVSGLGNLFVFFNLRTIETSYFLLLEGIISIVLGIFIIANDNGRENILPFLIAFWIILKSLTAIITSVTLKKVDNPSWRYFLSWGIIGIILGLLVTAFPKIMIFYISFIIGGIVLLISLLLIYTLIKVRKI